MHDSKDKVHFKIFIVITWETNNFNISIAQKTFFFEKSYTKCGGETFPRPFCKNSKLIISVNKQPKVYTVCFYCMTS